MRACLPSRRRGDVGVVKNTHTHTTSSHTTLSHTVTYNFATYHLSRTTLSHTILSHTIFHTQLWQACSLRGRRCTYGTGLDLVARLVPVGCPGRRGTLRGRCGTWRRPPSFCVAGVALGEIHIPFAWQAWHLWHWAGSGGALGPRWSPGRPGTLRGRCGTCRHPPSFCVAAWHLWHWAGSGRALGPRWSPGAPRRLATSTFVLRGRCGTRRHPPSFCSCVAAVALAHIGFCARLIETFWSDVGMCYSQLRARHVWPCFAVFVSSLASSIRLLLRHLVIYFWSGRFGSTWEETLCMFDRYFVEAILACFCMFDRNLLVEAMLACFALAQRGKRPCACLFTYF